MTSGVSQSTRATSVNAVGGGKRESSSTPVQTIAYGLCSEQRSQPRLGWTDFFLEELIGTTSTGQRARFMTPWVVLPTKRS